MAQKEHTQENKKNTSAENKSKSNGNDNKKDHEIKASNLTKEDRAFLEEHADELGRTALRARWIHKADEKAERKGQTLATRSPEVIQKWAEARKAVPATVEGTEHGDLLGVLRLNFPGYSGSTLKQVGWDEWFKTFEARELVFIYQEQKRDGQQSNFFILDSPNREDG